MELTKSFRDLRVVHLWVVLSDLATLEPGPDHKGIHWPLDVILVALSTSTTLFPSG